MSGRIYRVSLLLLAGLIAGLPARAEPPARVGRVAATQGNVAVRAAGGEWADAAVNDPVASGMAVRTGAGSRSVLRIGALTIALAPASEIELAAIDWHNTDLILRAGRLGVGLALDPPHNVEIDLPEGGVWLLTRGDFDVTAGGADTPARIAAPVGRAHFVGRGLDTVVTDGSAALLGGQTPVSASLQRFDADDFSQWWRPAADADPDGAALQHVSAEMTGYRALDTGGHWEQLDGVGAAWFPTAVPAGWAPYREGHWRWIAPWGWTWIDDMPWGFVTSHYGRWARVLGTDAETARWGWVPGEHTADPVYAPAVVAFLGTPAVGLSYPDASGPAVAWFPLAPGEVYWPRFTGDLGLIRRINRGGIADVLAIGPAVDGGPPAAIVDGVYRNRRFASVVPRPVFIGGKPVAAALVQLPQERLDNAPLLGGSPEISPPTPHPAVAAAPGTLRAAPAPGRLVRAMHTLVRIIRRHRPTVFARAAAAEAPRRAPRPHRGVVASGHWRAPPRVTRPHTATATPRTTPARLRLAVVHRRVDR